MNSIEQARFNPLYQQMQQALLLQGKRPKTIAAYSRGVRRVADYVDRCPDNLTADELKSYFASLVVDFFNHLIVNETLNAQCSQHIGANK